MTTYRITSDNCSLGSVGDTVSDDQLDGLNISALVDGGHLAANSVKVSKSDTKESDK